MSWDVYVWNFDGNLPPADDALRVWYSTHDEEVAADVYGDLPPLSDERVAAATSKAMGTPAEVRAKIDAHLPGVEWSDDYGGIYSGEDFTFEIDVGGQSQLDSFKVHVGGGGDAVGTLLQFATPNGWSLFDTTGNDFIDPDNPSDTGWTRWQGLRDQVVERYHAEESAPSLKHLLSAFWRRIAS